MAAQDQATKAARISGKGSPSSKAPETKGNSQPKRAAPTARKPREAATTAAATKATSSPRKAKAEAAAQAAAEAQERLERTEMAKVLSEGGRTVAAKSWKNLLWYDPPPRPSSATCTRSG